MKTSFCCTSPLVRSGGFRTWERGATKRKSPLTATWAQRTTDDAMRAKVDSLVKQMTLQEKIDMCHGGTSFATKRIARLGIHPWEMTDGPGGVRTDSPDKSTNFPTGVSLASTWDPLLIYRVGQAMGQQARFFKKDVLLGPAVNIIRTPLGGRSFEYMSEDPFLAGSLAVPYIRGVQSQGVAACIKHFAANSQEIERDSIDAQVSERALQEIYLPAFKAGVQQGHVLAVMDAYNRLQGTYCTANSHLNNEILKRDWGFLGVVMSDWGATHDTVGAALGGLDVEMPGGGPGDFMADALLRAVKDGKVPESVIDDKVRRILWAIHEDRRGEAKWQGRSQFSHPPGSRQRGCRKRDHPSQERQCDAAPRCIETEVRCRDRAMGNWPSRWRWRQFIGVSALRSLSVGGHRKATRPDGQSANRRWFQLWRTASAGRTVRCTETNRKVDGAGLRAEYFNNKDLQGSPATSRVDPSVEFNWTGGAPASGVGRDNFSVRWTGVFVAPKDGTYRLGTSSDDGSRVFLDGKLLVDNWGDHAFESKSATVELKAGSVHDLRIEYYQAAGDAEVTFGWSLPSGTAKTEIEQAVDAAKASDVAVVLVGTNHSWDTEGSDKPSMKLMGDQEKLVQAVAAANPRTVVVLINGSAVEVGSWINKVPALLEAWYPGMEGGNAIAEVLFGDVNPSGKLPETFPVKLADSPAHANGDYPGKDGKLKYDDGIYVGYRYFDTKHVKPQFPFGHGLSYTSFKYTNIKVEWPSPDAPVVSVDVTNTGQRSGAEVVQLYVHQQHTVVDRPEKELKGYQKVKLEAGHSQNVQIPLDRGSFSYFDPNKKTWTFDKGMFDLLVGSSSRDIRQHTTINYGQAQ